MVVSKKKIAVVGSGIMGSCLAYTFTKEGVPFQWFVGDRITASSAAGAMVTTVSEWDFNVSVEYELRAANLRVDGAKKLREIIKSLNLQEVEEALLVYDNVDGDLEKICKIVNDSDLDVNIVTDGEKISFGEYCIDARLLLRELFIYSKNSKQNVVNHNVISSVSSQNGMVQVAIKNGPTEIFDQVILCTGYAPELFSDLFPSTDDGDKIFRLNGVSILRPNKDGKAKRYLNTLFGCGLHEIGLKNATYLGSTSSLSVGNIGGDFDELAHLSYLTEELVKCSMLTGTEIEDSTLSGQRAISVDRKPKIFRNKEKNIFGITGLARTGFSTAPIIATSISKDVQTGSDEAQCLFDYPTDAKTIFGKQIENYQSSNSKSMKALKIFSKQYPISEVISWSEAVIK